MPRVDTRLGRWFYEESGTEHAPTAVLLHGLFFDGRMWEGQVPALARTHRVVVLDGPGHGRSDVPPPFTLEDHAAAIGEAFDALAIERATVIGLSWGAMAALRLALAHPARVHGLAVLGGSAEVESFRDVAMASVATVIGRRLPLPAALARAVLVPRILSPHTVREDPALVDRVVRTMQSQSSEGVARASRAVVGRSHCLLGSLAYIRTPSLVLCGEDDRTTPVARSRRIAAGIPAARLTVLSRCGHMTALEQPGLVSDALAGFCRAAARAAES